MKGPSIRRLYYSKKEVSQILKIKSGVLRNWELKFPISKPTKSKSGRRLYKPRDLEMLLRIQKFRDQGFTDEKINNLIGKKSFKQRRQGFKPDIIKEDTPSKIVEELREELQDIIRILDQENH